VWAWTVGARREAYEQLAAWHAATKPPRDERLQAAYLRALAWWAPIWLGEVKPPPAEDLVGPERCWFPGADCPPPAADEAPPAAAPALAGEPRAAVAARYAAARSASADVSARANVDPTALMPIASAFFRDPVIAERLGRDYVASEVDAAAGYATLGALFDALGDPGRARTAWQSAVELSPEPAFVRGLAEATARGGDGTAALVFATQASAAWGDPAVVWAGVANALVGAGQHVDALTAARNAIDLAGPEVLPRAIDSAVAASRALGRTAQADALLVQRAQLAPRTKSDEADAHAALVAHREQPTAATAARLWVASRAHPRDVEVRAALVGALEADDPRRATVTEELVALAADPDPERALAAVAALRR
jgi:tetratricopeptide (TPR) repeat protein